MSNPDIDAMAERLTDTLMGTVGRLAEEHNLTTSEYLRAKAYHAHLEEYPFHLVVKAMRINGLLAKEERKG